MNQRRRGLTVRVFLRDRRRPAGQSWLRDRDARDPDPLDHVLESARDSAVLLDVGHRQLSKAQVTQRRKKEMARHRERKIQTSPCFVSAHNSVD